jgi:adenylate cyclase
MQANGSLTVRLFGPVEVRAADGRDVTPLGKKLRALLACLALGNEKGWARERLCALFWNDRDEEQARASLRQALAELRRLIGKPSSLKSDRDMVALDPACITVDVSEFGRLAAAGQFEQAASLYRGDLMDGQIPSDGEFAAWLAVERTKLHDLAIEVLTKLAETQAGESAIATVQRMLQLDPAREGAHRMLMRLYAAGGRRGQALRQYQICRDILQRELDVSPEPETENLLKQLQSLSNRTTTDESVVAGKSSIAVLPFKPDAVVKPSIAVLPFANMSGDSEQEYFSDGITEDVITDLSKISALHVVARNTVFTYKGRPTKIEQVAHELGVRYVLEGSVRKAGSRIRVAAQLIDGKDGGHLWAERYDRELTDIFAIQDEITQAIVDQLKVKLLPEEKKTAPPTENVEAYTYYLRGRQLFHEWTKPYLLLARRMFTKAVELDPRYARAYAGIADSESVLHVWYAAEVSIDNILAMSANALELDPNLAEAHASRGLALQLGERRDEAIAEFERALALDPNLYEANFFYARLRWAHGEFEECARLFARAAEIRPDDYVSPLLLLNSCRSLGREADYQHWARITVERCERALTLHPESPAPASRGALALAHLGERDRAMDWADRALATDPDDTVTLYNVTGMYAVLGDSEHALDLLEKFLPNDVSTEQRSWFENDSDPDSLRSHPRYAQLMSTMEARRVPD